LARMNTNSLQATLNFEPWTLVHEVAAERQP
jgi:hypothetical protein